MIFELVFEGILAMLPKWAQWTVAAISVLLFCALMAYLWAEGLLF